MSPSRRPRSDPVDPGLTARLDQLAGAVQTMAGQFEQIAKLALAHDQVLKDQGATVKDLHDALTILIQKLGAAGASAPANGQGPGAYPPGTALSQMPPQGPAASSPGTTPEPTQQQADAAGTIMGLARQFFPSAPTPSDQMAELGVQLLKGMVTKVNEEASLSGMLTRAIAQRIAAPVGDRIAAGFD